MMATRFPGALDRDPDELPDNIADSDNLNSPNHATIHNNVNGAVLQIEEKLGTGDTTPASGAVLIGTGTGTSAWDTTPTFVGDVTIPEGDLILGSTAVTSTAAEINLLDGVTGGTVAASKAVVVDANKDIASFRNVTLTGELDAATLDISGDVDIDGAADIAGDLVLSGGADGALQFTNAGENSIKIPDNQASALIIEEADNAYITFTTTDSSEAITVAKATTFSSTVNIDGNVDVDANTQLDGTLTVGVDDTGHDVIFYGATSGSYVQWDESLDDFKFHGDAVLRFDDTTAGSSNFQIQFKEGYNILADNTGTGSDNSRLWISGDAGGSFYIGPRAGGSLFEDIFLRADVTVSGALSKGSGSFDIPHPTKGGNWRLRHSFLEGPTCDNIYRGTVTISGSSATVDLDTVSNMTDGTWEALNTNSWSMVASSGNAVTWGLSGKTLTISGPDGAVCNWMVIGERKDDNIKGSKQTDNNGKLITEYENADIDADADAGE
jgi:hypothetical protein